MNTITIKDKTFELESGAHDALKKYIDEIRHHFRDEEEVSEDILDAVAERMEEILSERESDVLTKSDIERLIDQFGTIEDIAGMSEAEVSTQVISKKLYRDKENKVIAGIASGMAAYFEVPIWVVRVLFIVMIFTPIPIILAYLAMWFITPVASTKADRLRMAGAPVSLATLSTTEDGFMKRRVMTLAKILIGLVVATALLCAAVITIAIAAIINFGVLQNDIYISKSDGTSVQANTLSETELRELDVLEPELVLSYVCEDREEYNLTVFSNNKDFVQLSQQERGQSYGLNYDKTSEGEYKAQVDSERWPENLSFDDQTNKIVLQGNESNRNTCNAVSVEIFDPSPINL